MTQLSLQWLDEARYSAARTNAEPRARRNDPETSKRAAAAATAFVGTHNGKIFGWLVDHPAGGTYREIAAAIGLEPIAVARRMKGLQQSAGIYADGERNGMQVWRVRT